MVSETHVGHVPVEGGHHPAKPEPELGRCEIRMLRLSSFCHSVMLRRKERKKMILIKEPTKLGYHKGRRKMTAATVKRMKWKMNKIKKPEKLMLKRITRKTED